MAEHLDLSSEFAQVAKRLRDNPDNPFYQAKLLSLLPQMKQAAGTGGNPITLYRLAKAFPRGSDSYLLLMKQAADLGCTNAMLTMADLSIEARKFRDATHYLEGIFASEDSYIITQARQLLGNHPRLGKTCNFNFFRSDNYPAPHQSRTVSSEYS